MPLIGIEALEGCSSGTLIRAASERGPPKDAESGVPRSPRQKPQSRTIAIFPEQNRSCGAQHGASSSAHFCLDLINGKRVLVPAPDKIVRFHGAERRFVREKSSRGLFIAHRPLVGNRAAWHRRWRLERDYFIMTHILHS